MSSLRLAAALLVFSMVAGSAYAQTPEQSVDGAKINALFAKHDCGQTKLEVCTKPTEDHNKTDCNTFKKIGQCLFDKCPDIKGTVDAQSAAEIVVKYAAETISNCDIKPNELINGENSATGSLNRNVGTVIGFALVTALVKIFFY